MITKDLKRLNMLRSVEELCNANENIVSSNPAFVVAKGMLGTYIADILVTASAQGKVITGITTDKNVAKNHLVQAAADIAGLVFAYASAINNNTLKEAVDFSYTDIDKLKSDMLVATVINIYDATKVHLAVLANVGVSAAQLAELKAKTEIYSKSLPTNRTATSERSTQTDNLGVLIRDAVIIVKEQMDKLVVSFKALNPDFVSSYFNARIVIDEPSHLQKMEVPV